MNNKTLRTECQIKFNEELIHSLIYDTYASKRIFHELMKRIFNHNPKCYASHDTIARWSGVSRKTVFRFFDKYVDAGLFTIVKRYHRRPNEYMVHPMMYIDEVRKQLANDFKAMRYYCLTALTITSLVIQHVLPKQNLDHWYFVSSLSRPLTAIYLTTRCLSSVLRDSLLAEDVRARERFLAVMNRDAANSKKIQPEKRTKMEEGVNPIPAYIEELTQLQLTKAGKIRLCAFPEAAVRYAYQCFKRQNDVRNPYRWFFAVCNGYCNENKIQPAWHKVRFLLQSYGIADDAPTTTCLPVPVAAEKTQAVTTNLPLNQEQVPKQNAEFEYGYKNGTDIVCEWGSLYTKGIVKEVPDEICKILTLFTELPAAIKNKALALPGVKERIAEYKANMVAQNLNKPIVNSFYKTAQGQASLDTAVSDLAKVLKNGLKREGNNHQGRQQPAEGNQHSLVSSFTVSTPCNTLKQAREEKAGAVEYSPQPPAPDGINYNDVLLYDEVLDGVM